VVVELRLRRLWGAPQDWPFEGDDERVLRRLLARLDEFKSDPDSGEAVLIAAEGGGHVLGAWTRQGARQLEGAISHGMAIGQVPSSDLWGDVRDTLLLALSGK
jgi:hypothetical protein